MAGLLDFLQSASNAAASNVSGPVDALAWLLKKAGVDVGEPVGGSQWMERQGLTRPVQQGAARVAGETAGLLAPIAVAAKAPQIAKGLLQMGENAAAPRTLNPQTGAIVWHGSPHKFDRFDSSKIGTGEGAQAYGHGLYLAESPDVARQYADALGTHKTTIGGKPVTPDMPDYAAIMEVAARGHKAALADAKAALASGFVDPAYQAKHIAALERLAPLAKTIKQVQDKSVYKVDLPDPVIARMLDWDKPLSQQATIKRALQVAPDPNLRWANSWANPYFSEFDSFTGARLIDSLKSRGALDGTTQAMRRAGIPGIRYLDGGSRGAGSGTSNFVVFPGEENILTILERNGIPLR